MLADAAFVTRGGSQLTWHCRVMSMSLRSKAALRCGKVENLSKYFNQLKGLKAGFDL